MRDRLVRIYTFLGSRPYEWMAVIVMSTAVNLLTARLETGGGYGIGIDLLVAGSLLFFLAAEIREAFDIGFKQYAVMSAGSIRANAVDAILARGAKRVVIHLLALALVLATLVYALFDIRPLETRRLNANCAQKGSGRPPQVHKILMPR